jgi:hypothetical protein
MAEKAGTPWRERTRADAAIGQSPVYRSLSDIMHQKGSGSTPHATPHGLAPQMKQPGGAQHETPHKLGQVMRQK